MRFAPPYPLRIADRASGLNALTVRSYNERLVLSLLLQNEGISRLELGKRTGLSAQTVSVIVRSLEQEGLVTKGEAQRGRVGPPTIPLSLNPEGAYSIGVSISSRTTQVVLVDFVGNLCRQEALRYSVPDSDLLEQIASMIKDTTSALQRKYHDRVTGMGLALPSDIDAWVDRLGVPKGTFSNIESKLERLTGLSVFVQNDITAVAVGESMFGRAKAMTNYLFLFLGARLHCRLVLDHHIYQGNEQIAPPSAAAGLLSLEDILINEGIETEGIWDSTLPWPDCEEFVNQWKDKVREELLRTMESLAQFVNIDTIVLSSYAPRGICEDICRDLEAELSGLRALAGAIVCAPKASGAASLPFSSRFMA